jgi:TPR repeat protein
MKTNTSMKFCWARRAATLLPALALVAALEAGAQEREAGTLEQGVTAYEAQRFAQALDRFEAAGEAGDLRAQEMAAMMWLYGELLYGGELASNPTRALYWLRKAAANGSETSRLLGARVQARLAQGVAAGATR